MKKKTIRPFSQITYKEFESAETEKSGDFLRPKSSQFCPLHIVLLRSLHKQLLVGTVILTTEMHFKIFAETLSY